MLTKKPNKTKSQSSACDELNDFYTRMKAEIPKARLGKSDLSGGDLALIFALLYQAD